jgi:hypothetical protein
VTAVLARFALTAAPLVPSRAAEDWAAASSGRGACVIDSYSTSKASYREIARLVAGRRSSAVVVAAAPHRHVRPAGRNVEASGTELCRLSGPPGSTWPHTYNRRGP